MTAPGEQVGKRERMLLLIFAVHGFDGRDFGFGESERGKGLINAYQTEKSKARECSKLIYAPEAETIWK